MVEENEATNMKAKRKRGIVHVKECKRQSPPGTSELEGAQAEQCSHPCTAPVLSRFSTEVGTGRLVATIV
jgi:hypothetical protein